MHINVHGIRGIKAYKIKTSSNKSMQQKFILFSLVTLLGLLGNILNIEMFFGVNQIFGSIFVLLAVWFLGPMAGVLCAVIVHSYTIYLWGHPYAFVSFVLEALVVGYLVRWKISNLFLADIIYWCLIGIWLVPLFYGQGMGLPDTQVSLIMLKQPANGILNALLATLLGFLLIRFRFVNFQHFEQINLQNLLFTIIMTCVAIALYTTANIISKDTFIRFQKQIATNLEKSANYIQFEWQDYVQEKEKKLAQLADQNIKQQSPKTLYSELGMHSIWVREQGQYRLLASHSDLASENLIPPKQFKCAKEMFFTYQKQLSFLIVPSGENCFMGIYTSNLMQDFLDTRLYLSDLNVMVEFSEGIVAASVGEPNTKLLSLQNVNKVFVDNNIYHLLPKQKMAKMLKWKKSSFVYELPIKHSSQGKILLLRSFSSYINSLQQIYIFTFSALAMVILFTALISYFISKYLVKSLQSLGETTANLPDKLLNGQIISWPRSRIKEINALSTNFSLLTDVLKSIFKESDLRYRKLFEGAKDAILVLELPSMQVIDHNPMAENLFTAGLFEKDSLRISELINGLSASIIESDQDINDNIYWIIRPEQGLIPVRLDVQYLHLKGKNIVMLNIQDISAEIKHKEQLNLIAKVFETTSEGILITDSNSKIVMVNQGFTKITGYEAQESIGKKPSTLHSGWQDKLFYQKMWQTIQDSGKWEGEIWNRRKNGELYAEWLSIYRVADEQGKTSNYIGVFIDITEKKRTQEKINQLAYFDVLTGLPNRQLFTDRIEHAIHKAKRTKNSLALLFFDLDNFKTVNDSLGHHAGDLLLKGVSQRINQIIRDSDTFARLGGDEFTIILEDIKNKEHVVSVAEKIISSLAIAFSIENKEVYTSASIGACIYPDDANSIEEMMQYADIAMYRAKETGKKGFEFYTSSMNTEARRHMEIEIGLRKAIEKDQLSLHYQPQVNIENNKILAVEALVRWIDPDIGFVSPGEFIPIAESSDLMGQIENWVIKTAASQLKQWHQQGINICMSINISDHNFRKNNFVETTLAGIKTSGLDCAYFDLELTERIVMDTKESYHKITQLKEAGFKLSLDDFGTGQSSLSYLKRFNIDKLKIDKSFVDDIPHDKQSCEIANAIVSLAQAMNMATVAEGIEDKQQMEYLCKIGCDSYQGYLFSKPLPAEQFEDFYRQCTTRLSDALASPAE